MDEMVIKVAVGFFVWALSSIATYLVALYKTRYEAAAKKEKERDEAIAKLTAATQLIMRRDLREDAKKYLADNKLTEDEYEGFEEYYKCYEDLGQNGKIDKVVKRVRELPIVG